SSSPRPATSRWACRYRTSASWSPFRASMSAWMLVTPLRPAARPVVRLGSSYPEARPGAGLEVGAKPLDQGREVRLVAFGRRQVLRDARGDLLECLAEQPVHVVPPYLSELTPVSLDGREVLGQVMVEPHQVGPELRQRLNIVDNPSHGRFSCFVSCRVICRFLRIQRQARRGSS